MFSSASHFSIWPQSWKLLFCSAWMLMLLLPAQASQSVTLSWDSAGDKNIAGYKIYFGTSSQEYYDSVTVNNTNNATITGLDAGTTYYFAATSFNAAGMESPLSAEAAYTVPIPATTLTAATKTTGQFSFNVSDTVGRVYVVQASTDLVNWVSVETNTAPFVFVDTAAASFKQRFYRTYDQQLFTAATAAVAAAATPATLTDSATVDGQFSFTVNGATGQQYVVQASTNLVDWVSVETNTAPFVFVDTDASIYKQRFYRTFNLAP